MAAIADKPAKKNGKESTAASQPRYLTVKAFADYFDMSVSGVHKAIEAGKLTCVELPGTGNKVQRRIPYTEIARIESGRPHKKSA